MNVHFACTQCGKCCRDSKLPLTVAEAIGWLGDGHDVQVLCEAEPWPVEPAAGDEQALHRRRRSFAAMSGSLPSRVTVVLAGNLEGHCPNLLADLRCGIYERRPLVCRIYPAEINPFIRLDPAGKSCPPDAWSRDLPLLQQEGRWVDAAMRRDIRQSRDTDARDVAAKQSLCAALGLDRAGVAREGVMVYRPVIADLWGALTGAGPAAHGTQPPQWQYVTKSPATVQDIRAQGAVAALVGEHHPVPYQYFGAAQPSKPTRAA